MQRVRTPKQVWLGWTAPTVEGDLARRREAVLLETLATLVVIGIVAQSVQLANALLGAGNADFWVWAPAVTLTTLGFYLLLRRARSGRHRSSSVWLLVVLSAPGFGLLATQGVSQSVWPLLSATVVLLAAILLGRRAALAATAIHCIAIICVAAAQAAGSETWVAETEAPRLSAASGPILLLLLIARSCWIYTREIVTGIDEVLSHGAESSPLRQLRTKTLSVREIEVVQLVAEGLSNDAIAKRLFLSPRTVQSHVANAMGKSETSNRTELGVLAIREGLVPLSAPGGTLTMPSNPPEYSGVKPRTAPG